MLTVDPTFIKITGQSIVRDSEPSQTGNWCDYDNDNWVDVFVANSMYEPPVATNSLYHNSGDGTFTRVTNALTTVAMNTWGALWGDYDDDGYADLLVIPFQGPSYLL